MSDDQLYDQTRAMGQLRICKCDGCSRLHVRQFRRECGRLLLKWSKDYCAIHWVLLDRLITDEPNVCIVHVCFRHWAIRRGMCEYHYAKLPWPIQGCERLPKNELIAKVDFSRSFERDARTCRCWYCLKITEIYAHFLAGGSSIPLSDRRPSEEKPEVDAPVLGDSDPT
jgi:hypothetical protein